MRVPKEKRKSKWDKKADLGILLGYDSVGYKILINNIIVISRNVEIIEGHVNLLSFKGDFENNNDLVNNDDEIESNHSSESNLNNQHNEGVRTRKSTRIRNKPNWYGINSATSNYIFVNYVSADSQITFDDVLESSECELWKQAVKKEIDVINKNKTWKLVEKPLDKRTSDLK